jgi:hypothetical protein
MRRDVFPQANIAHDLAGQCAALSLEDLKEIEALMLAKLHAGKRSVNYAL